MGDQRQEQPHTKTDGDLKEEIRIYEAFKTISIHAFDVLDFHDKTNELDQPKMVLKKKTSLDQSWKKRNFQV